ncbi:MAG TPA: septal ring lytic transglycosylase RlpA family protein [Allosphingosinicella sp.]|nr:septal ring lytic transglycosylase RlpA family protein [Allosphingosinicella sp.]
MIATMRKSATHGLVAVALMALTASGPAHAVTSAEDAPAETLAEIVADLPAQTAPIFAPALPEVAPRYEAAGEGVASFYGNELAGNRTASGERFNPHAMTAAHRSLPLGTKLRVTNLNNGEDVIVRVNDRGPFAKSRIIDLSLGAARDIGMVRAGTARVKLEVLRTA